MTKIYTPEQQQFIREARKEYCEFATEIDKQKQYTKELFEALVDKLGIDPKEDKESIKSLRQGFSMYYKNSKETTERVVDGAIEIASL
jgi:hypothetical protein